MTYIVFEHKDPETGETKDLTVFADGTTSSDVSDPEHLLQNFKDEIMNAFMAKHLGKGKGYDVKKWWSKLFVAIRMCAQQNCET